MDHFGLAVRCCDVLFLERAARKHADSVSVYHYVVFALFQVEGGDLGLPKLEGLVPEEWPRVFTRDINDINVVSVDIDGLVTDDQLLELFGWVSHHCNVGIGDVQLVLVLQEELVLDRIVLLELDQEHAELLLVLVGEQVEHARLVVVYDLFDIRHLESFLQVDEPACAVMVVDAVVHRGNNRDRLLVIHIEELWLPTERLLKLH